MKKPNKDTTLTRGWNGSRHYTKLTDAPSKKKKHTYFSLKILWLGILPILVMLLCNTNISSSDHSRAAKQDRINKPIKNIRKKKYTPTIKPSKTIKVSIPEINNSNIFFKPRFEGRIVVWTIKDPPVFTNQFEDFVATVLTTVPGERFLETDLAEDFDRSFFESLKHNIVINPFDSDKVIAMKQAVIEAKEEVKRLVEQGERPRDIVLSARSELNKIADYRDDIQREFNKFLITATDPNDVFAFLKESNEILNEYGAAPIDGPHDLETAYEMMEHAKDEKLKELEAMDKNNNGEQP